VQATIDKLLAGKPEATARVSLEALDVPQNAQTTSAF
jgi:hypothetical protein